VICVAKFSAMIASALLNAVPAMVGYDVINVFSCVAVVVVPCDSVDVFSREVHGNLLSLDLKTCI